MSIFKRGNVYWYHFLFNGQHVQESTKQGNPRVARNMESAHRTALAKGEVGFRERKALSLADFLKTAREMGPFWKLSSNQAVRRVLHRPSEPARTVDKFGTRTSPPG